MEVTSADKALLQRGRQPHQPGCIEIRFSAREAGPDDVRQRPARSEQKNNCKFRPFRARKVCTPYHNQAKKQHMYNIKRPTNCFRNRGPLVSKQLACHGLQERVHTLFVSVKTYGDSSDEPVTVAGASKTLDGLIKRAIINSQLCIVGCAYDQTSE